jgi:hypothetical protein
MAPIMLASSPLLILIGVTRQQLPHSFLAWTLVFLFFVVALLLFSISRRFSDVLIERARHYPETPLPFPPWILRIYNMFGGNPELTVETLALWFLNFTGVIFATSGLLRYGMYPISVMAFYLLIVLIVLLSTLGLVALAAFVGGSNHDKQGKIKFAWLGLWHATALIPSSLPSPSP